MKRLLLATLLGGILALSLVGTALAFSCTVVNKQAGAGSAATATFNVDTFVFTITGANLNPGGHLKGTFITVTVLNTAGDVLRVVDVFATKELPDGAHNAGPGNNWCDFIGVDDAAACGP